RATFCRRALRGLLADSGGPERNAPPHIRALVSEHASCLAGNFNCRDPAQGDGGRRAPGGQPQRLRPPNASASSVRLCILVARNTWDTYSLTVFSEIPSSQEI